MRYCTMYITMCLIMVRIFFYFLRYHYFIFKMQNIERFIKHSMFFLILQVEHRFFECRQFPISIRVIVHSTILL